MAPDLVGELELRYESVMQRGIGDTDTGDESGCSRDVDDSAWNGRCAYSADLDGSGRAR